MSLAPAAIVSEVTPFQDPETWASDDVKQVSAPVEIVIISTIALLLGVVLRFTTKSSLWLDEALNVNISHLPLADLPAALRHDGHPPLYYALLHEWMLVFGSGDHAVRSLSGLLGLLTLPLAWFAGRRRGGPLVGWLAVSLMALSPFALRYSTEARMYELVIVLVLAGYLVVDDIARRQRRGRLVLIELAAISGALLLTHYWSLWLLASLEVVLLWRWVRGSDQAKRLGARNAFVAIAIGGLFFVPWLPSFFYQAAHTGTPWGIVQRPTSIIAVALADFGGGSFRDAELFGGLILVLVLLGVFASGIDREKILIELRTRPAYRSEAAVIALTFSIGAVLAALSSGAFASRYAAVVFPLLILLAAGGIACFLDRRIRAVVLVGFLACCLLGAYWNVTFQRTQGRVAADAINSAAVSGDVVVFCPDQLGPAFSRSLRDDVQAMVYPTLGSPKFVDWVDYAKRNRETDPVKVAQTVAERAAGHQIFVVWQPGYHTFENQCESFYASLSAARPGATTLVVAGAATDFYEPGAVSLLPIAP